MAIILDGKALAEQTRQRIAQEVTTLSRQPGLAVILVGDDPASRLYVSNKEKDCAQCGFKSFEHRMAADTTEAELLALIAELNTNDDVDGILVQLPLPKHLNEEMVIQSIAPEKDVDAFHPYNVGRMSQGKPVFLPCTPAGVMAILKAYDIDVAGKDCVVIGRSNIVGKPMGMLLTQANGTVTICHSRTPNLAEYTKRADILVAAVGREGLVRADMVKEGAVVIDVAMNRNAAGKFCGDVDFEAVKAVASHITPVPGGVGPMTRALLLENILTAAKRK
ncbi:bifunctional methylenetetrahydrofolate dehydrogenase/methenyltetrahydrofolate cyclohydrolase FolD [Bengtsoniella intestinalis]|uniref:bifunctional methylenetetrahydrofolate dehydrogenase/methenyltetrahydrofolate cyclohydrolase FolD n=1 Tax=Bengtsoniella intestinalis TaxID=3073143 RepID=UPI00391FC186